MPLLSKSLVSLRIFGDELVPEEMDKLFGCSASRAWKKGDQPVSSAGKNVTKKTGAWLLECDTDTGDFDSQISQLFMRANISIDKWMVLSRQFEIDVYCGWFMNESNEGVEVSPHSLRGLSERNIQLSIEMYAPSC